MTKQIFALLLVGTMVGGGCTSELDSAPDAGSGTCAKDSDCGQGKMCVYSIGDGCSAKATCQAKPDPVCLILFDYCGCNGQTVAVGCDTPDGYARAPVQHEGTCGDGGDGGP